MKDIDWIYELADTEIQCVESQASQQHTIEIKQYGNYRWFQADGAAIQSVIDLEQPATVLNPVSKIMLSGCYFCPELNSVLNIGMGGGSVERFFWHFLADTMVYSVESDESIIHLAREYFQIPSSKPVFNVTAERYLQQTDTQYNLIFCDIFNGQDHPDCLYEQTFYKLLRKRLKQNGLVLLNLVPKDQQDLLDILLAIKPWFKQLYLCELEDHFNVIVVATDQTLETTNRSKQNRELEQSGQLLEMDRFVTLLKPLTK